MKFTCPAGNKSRQRPQGLHDLMYQDKKKGLAVESDREMKNW